MSCTRTRGKTSPPQRDPADPPRRRGNKRKGHGTYANDRPPIISVIARETGEQRFWVCDDADTRTCHELIADNIPPDSTRLYTDEWQSYHGSHAAHATVCHSAREWARDDDGDGRREVHCNSWKERARRSGLISVPSAVSTSSTCICMWRRMKPWSTRNESRLI
jgi:transposase